MALHHDWMSLGTQRGRRGYQFRRVANHIEVGCRVVIVRLHSIVVRPPMLRQAPFSRAAWVDGATAGEREEQLGVAVVIALGPKGPKVASGGGIQAWRRRARGGTRFCPHTRLRGSRGDVIFSQGHRG
jgi:hypothetical protein